jgi:hypothetical protein
MRPVCILSMIPLVKVRDSSYPSLAAHPFYLYIAPWSRNSRVGHALGRVQGRPSKRKLGLSSYGRPVVLADLFSRAICEHRFLTPTTL